MPIPAKPTITAPPSPLPTRGESPTTFSNNINALVAWYPDLDNNLNDSIDWMDLVFIEVESEAEAAAQSAADAQTAETGAVAAKTAAEAARDNVLSNVNFRGLWAGKTNSDAPPASYLHDGAYWQLLVALADVSTVEPGTDPSTWAPAGGFVKFTEISVSGNFTPDTATKLLVVRCVGGGGAGASGAAGNSRYCGGGSGGEGVESILLASDLVAPVSCTIGAGGAGVSGSTMGNAGSATSFGSYVSAQGGYGGNSGTSATGSNGASSSGAKTANWAPANFNYRYIKTPASGYGGANPTSATDGEGGNSIIGGAGGGAAGYDAAGPTRYNQAGGTSTLSGDGGAGNSDNGVDGVAGASPGGGGGGTADGGTSGPGGDGIIYVWEWQ